MLMRLIASIGLVLALATPSWASYSFDGTDDRITSADNAFTEGDISTFTWFACVKVTAQPASNRIIEDLSTASGGTDLRVYGSAAPATSGWRFQFFQQHTSQGGEWRYDTDLSLNVWYKIQVDWDSNQTTDPVVRINGTSVAVTELLTPSNVRTTGADTLRFGELTGGANDFTGKIEQRAMWSTRLDESTSMTVVASSPSAVSTNRISYVPMLTDAVDADGATGTLTVTGATLDTSDHCYTGRRPIAPMLLSWLKSLLLLFTPAEVYAQ